MSTNPKWFAERAGTESRIPRSRLGRGACRAQKGRDESVAFTLLELLVVITIMGLLAAVALPGIRGMNKSNSMTAANRQLLDDINYARQRAIADHTSVYMVFVPPAVITWTPPTDGNLNKVMANLYGGQYTTYALLSLRSVGEQPGRSTPRYLTSWRSLPAGIFIATNKYAGNSASGLAPTFFYDNPNRPEFPFPVATNFASAKTDFHLPHFGFNYLGQLIYRSNSVDHLVSEQADNANHMYIPLARGSIFYQHNPATGEFLAQPGDVQETIRNEAYYTGYNSTNARGGALLPTTPIDESKKSYNQIYIDPLTGRAKVQRLQIQ